MLTPYISTRDCRPWSKYEVVKSSSLNPSRRTSNYILLDYVQLLAPFFRSFYHTYPYIYRLFNLSHIPHPSIMKTANGTYAQSCQESKFTEESSSKPWERTRIQESTQCSLSIQCSASNYLPLWIVLRMTNVTDSTIEAGCWYWVGDWWWQKWGPHSVLPIIGLWSIQLGSPTGVCSSKPGAMGPVMTHYQGSIAKQIQVSRHCHCMLSAYKFPKFCCCNRTTTAQMTNGNPPQQIIRVWPCTIHPGAAATPF